MRKITTLAKSKDAQLAFERILAQELVAATDEEIVAAARDLGQNPSMKGSAAFIGLKYPSRQALRRDFEAGELHEVLRRALEGPGDSGPETWPLLGAPRGRAKPDED